jgi:hypothetical protein
MGLESTNTIQVITNEEWRNSTRIGESVRASEKEKEADLERE